MDYFFRNEELCSAVERRQQLTRAVAKADVIIKNKQRVLNRRRHNGYTDYERNSALMLYIISGYDVQPALYFLKEGGPKCRSSFWISLCW